MHVGQNRLKRKVPTRVKQGALPFQFPQTVLHKALGVYGKKSKIVWSRTCALVYIVSDLYNWLVSVNTGIGKWSLNLAK